MSPSNLSLAFLILIIPVVLLGEIVPAINLHLANNREAALRLYVEQCLAKGIKEQKSLADLEREPIVLPGISVKSLHLKADADYILAELDYEHTALIETLFFDVAGKTKTLKTLVAKVD